MYPLASQEARNCREIDDIIQQYKSKTLTYEYNFSVLIPNGIPKNVYTKIFFPSHDLSYHRNSLNLKFKMEKTTIDKSKYHWGYVHLVNLQL